jgi:serine/threonine-protein kinase
VHRDLKPANIFLVREQRRIQPKVVDFGIAKMDYADPESSKVLTRLGEVIGSPGYMSPEQARGSSVISGRTDVWAICVVLYECITGSTPFGGDNYNAWMRAIIEDAVVPSVDLDAGDAALWTILEQGLRKAPGERWSSMRELGAALAMWLMGQGVEQDVCGDPLVPYLNVHEPAPLDTSSRRRTASSRRSDPRAATVPARERSSSGRDADETGSQPFRLASAVTRTKPSTQAVSKTSIVAATHGGLMLLAASVGTIVALSSSPAHEVAAGMAGPSTLARDSVVPPPAIPVVSAPSAATLPEASPTASPSTEPAKKGARARTAKTPGAAPPAASQQAKPPAHGAAVSPTHNSDLKDPY